MNTEEGPGVPVDRTSLERETRVLHDEGHKLGPAGRVARLFIDSKLTPLLVVAALVVGVLSVFMTPREEEPQIQVPMIDVFIPFPGASAREVEERVATPFEKILWELPGVDHVYSTSSPDFALVIVRFKVGENAETSLVRVHSKILAHPDKLPAGAGPVVVKPKAIDDVPIVALTLWSEEHDDLELRRVANEVALAIRRIPNTAETTILGGAARQIQVRLEPARLQAHGTSALQIAHALQTANWQLPAGSLTSNNQDIALTTGSLLRTVDDVRSTVIGVHNGRTLHLDDAADIVDGGAERTSYVLFSAGPAAAHKRIEGKPVDAPAVTVAISKKAGANAVVLAHAIEAKVEELSRSTIPAGMHVTTTRNYGETAQEKSNELIGHVLAATAAVVLLVWFALGRREAVVVAVAVPVTLALTLATSSLFGYTLNRVTLFALVFAIGILVDDAIVVVENIHRHFRLGWTTPAKAAVHATDEVGNPTILATFAVIAALLPLAFVTGLMGPYMRPIPINASAAMFFSLLVAFVVSPWVTLRVLRGRVHAQPPAATDSGAAKPAAAGRIERLYAAALRPLLGRPRRAFAALAGVVLLLFASISLIGLRAVRFKMLPFDNKSEFQIIVDMPEGTTLEQTAAAARALGAVVRHEPEVTDFQVYAGTASPINFNGLVRHYFLRRGSHVADLQVNLVSKHERKSQSHDIAKRVRDKLVPVAARYGAALKVAEVPPGPPVLSTMVAEIYGPDPTRRLEVAAQVKHVFETTPGIVDVDWFVEAPQMKLDYRVDTQRAALAGITPEMIARELRMAGAGADIGLLHSETEREPVPIVLRMDVGDRPSLASLRGVALQAPDGRMVPLSELVDITETTQDRSIYHRNLRPVTYVIGETGGTQESPVYGVLDMRGKIAALQLTEGYALRQHYSKQPSSDERLALKWDGEWQITYEVFRDMGISFAVVMLLVYLLIVAWFKSFVTPLIIMAPIPLTLIGILPGHWLTDRFFTATSMIGFIALSGIIVRNSILLVDFIDLEIRRGVPLERAVLQAGAVRFRPIVLTAAALVIGGLVMVLDPIFQGLAVALIFGVIVSTALTLIVIPLLYSMYLKRVRARVA